MECYICGDEVSNPLRICACSSQHLHLHCQRRLLETVSPDGRCTVCRQRYTNVVCLHLPKDDDDATDPSPRRTASVVSCYRLLSYTITLLGILSSLCTWSRVFDTVQTHSILLSTDSEKGSTSLATLLILVQRQRVLLCYFIVSLAHILFIGATHMYFTCLIRAEIRAELRQQIASSFASSDQTVFLEKWVVDDDAGTREPGIA